MYPLTQIKADGCAQDLIDAIDGMETGNAPEMHSYKRVGAWGPAVKRYLRE